jgi:hypothetical protein
MEPNPYEAPKESGYDPPQMPAPPRQPRTLGLSTVEWTFLIVATIVFIISLLIPPIQ